MATERKPQDPAELEDEPTQEEIEEERHRAQTWKQPEDGKELSERDQERPLRP